MKSSDLTFRAGAGALESIRRHGFDLSLVGTIAGASGGAKWLALSQLDRAILASVVPRRRGPVHLIGSSIGSWRFACYDVRGFPIQRVELSEGNLEDAIVATGAIPLVLQGVRDIAGARPGMYRDGGVIDYHLDLPHSAAKRLTLFPHFFGRIVPGWFDKKLKWRRPRAGNVDRTILISPSASFVASLPNGKIPDRSDFANYEPAERVHTWRHCVAACRALADGFLEVMEKDQLAARLEPL